MDHIVRKDMVYSNATCSLIVLVSSHIKQVIPLVIVKLAGSPVVVPQAFRGCVNTGVRPKASLGVDTRSSTLVLCYGNKTGDLNILYLRLKRLQLATL